MGSSGSRGISITMVTIFFYIVYFSGQLWVNVKLCSNDYSTVDAIYCSLSHNREELAVNLCELIKTVLDFKPH